MRRLIFGCGYLGHRVARLWAHAGDDVFAVTRKTRRVHEFSEDGLHPLVADVTQPASLQTLPSVDTILFAVGHDRRDQHSIEEVYAGGVRKVLATLSTNGPRWIYVSSTGVYGDAAGGWIDECTPADPQRAGGRASLAAEAAIRESPLARRSVVLRMAGLYGPGRIPYLDELASGKPIPVAESGWLNLIHIEDAALAVVAADRWMSRESSDGPHCFNVADGCPVRRHDYYREVARLIGAPFPTFCTPDPKSHRAARSATDRRISSAAIRKTLALGWKYPSYREGLSAILKSATKAGSDP